MLDFEEHLKTQAQRKGICTMIFPQLSVLWNCSVNNMSNTRKSVSSGYPNTEKCVEFFNNFEVFGYPDETLFRVFDIASQTN